MKRTLLIVLLAFVMFGIGLHLQFGAIKVPSVPATNFEECVANGNAVMESYPRQCRDGENSFTEHIGNELEKMDLIRLENPRPNQIIKSPLVITGEARGYWFFEASFPVYLTDWDGLIIAQGIATAQDEWMTEEFVPFLATLDFVVDPNVYSKRGTLILRKENPSGLPEHDDALEIPIVYEKTDESGGSGIVPITSGIGGVVLLGPTCPVMREGDDSCLDKPFQTTVQIIKTSGAENSVFASVETDQNGRYKISLPPGQYVLQPISGNPFPSCGSVDVTIVSDKMIETNLYCDTGIR